MKSAKLYSMIAASLLFFGTSVFTESKASADCGEIRETLLEVRNLVPQLKVSLIDMNLAGNPAERSQNLEEIRTLSSSLEQVSRNAFSSINCYADAGLLRLRLKPKELTERLKRQIQLQRTMDGGQAPDSEAQTVKLEAYRALARGEMAISIIEHAQLPASDGPQKQKSLKLRLADAPL